MKHLAIAAVLLLSACGGGEEAGNNSSSSGGAVVEQTPTNLQDDPNNSVVPLSPPPAAPQPSATPVAALPAEFQGRWGVNIGDCDPSTGADKGKLIIASNRLSFFESRGEAKNIGRAQSTQIDFDLSMSGEGMLWSERTTLVLLDGGKTLVRQKAVPLEMPDITRYSRCLA